MQQSAEHVLTCTIDPFQYLLTESYNSLSEIVSNCWNFAGYMPVYTCIYIHVKVQSEALAESSVVVGRVFGQQNG